jgi:hypothetical protein
LGGADPSFLISKVRIANVRKHGGMCFFEILKVILLVFVAFFSVKINNVVNCHADACCYVAFGVIVSLNYSWF